MNKLKKWLKAFVFGEDEEKGFVHMRAPRKCVEFKSDSGSYEDLIYASRVIRETARAQYSDKYREEDFC